MAADDRTRPVANEAGTVERGIESALDKAV
jgi:hypothetical protein